MAVTDRGAPGVASSVVAAAPAVTPPTGGGTRGRRQSAMWRIRADIPPRWRMGLGLGGVVVVVVVWFVAAAAMANESLLPTPQATVSALAEMWSEGTLMTDFGASLERILIGYAISVVIGVVVGIAVGSFATFEALLEPPMGFLRYIPATALTPLFLLWLGIGESPKIWLIVVGTVFFNILMVADVASAIPKELLHASYTLGAGRRTILRRVILPHSVPGIVDVARINLAAAWLMLVVAELLAAQEGLAYQIVRAQRFRAVDTMFALLIVFGAIGLLSDVFLRWLRNRLAPWDRP